jgi:hypothetical protein
MSRPVFFLALNITVPYYQTMIALDSSCEFQAYRAYLEYMPDVVPGSHFIGYEALTIPRIGIGLKRDEELPYLSGATHCCEMQGCVPFFISYVRFSVIGQEQLQNV